jgi:hypothetical protein
VPVEILNIKGPVIGYCGALLSLRLDIELLYEIAHSNSEWNIVLVGPEDDDFRKSRLHEMPKCPFPWSQGSGNSSFIRLEILMFALILRLVNQMTIGNYPRKIDEYLAAGKPVVATSTRAMEEFKDYVYLCDSKEEIHQGN